MPPHTTTAKTTTRLQNKLSPRIIRILIELYGSPITKELKKSHFSRWVAGVEMWRCGMGRPIPMCGR